MDATRKTGVGLAIGAIVCWLVVGLAFVTTSDSEGVPIGAGLFYTAAVPLSIAASVLFLVTLRTRPTSSPARRAGRLMRSIAALLSLAAPVVLCTVFILGFTDAATGAVLRPLLLAGVVAFIAATAVVATLPDDREPFVRTPT